MSVISREAAVMIVCSSQAWVSSDVHHHGEGWYEEEPIRRIRARNNCKKNIAPICRLRGLKSGISARETTQVDADGLGALHSARCYTSRSARTSSRAARRSKKKLMSSSTLSAVALVVR
jgi:hypothetical protein